MVMQFKVVIVVKDFGGVKSGDILVSFINGEVFYKINSHTMDIFHKDFIPKTNRCFDFALFENAENLVKEKLNVSVSGSLFQIWESFNDRLNSESLIICYVLKVMELYKIYKCDDKM